MNKTMNATLSTSNYNDLNEFLTNHIASKNVNGGITHTRIGNKELNIYGGSYCIPPDNLKEFYKLYYEHVFVKKRKEYLTEKQLLDTGPILVDFDFRYTADVDTRMHTNEHVQDLIQLYLEEIKKLVICDPNTKIPIFIMEKPTVNRSNKDLNITKDGIHMIIGIQMERAMQLLLRDKIIGQINDIWELPLTNDWENVIDSGISKGCVNWQMYGSQKPGFDVYKLSYYLIAEIDENDNEWMTVPQNVKKFDLSTQLCLLSAQYDKHNKFEINPSIVEEYNRFNAKTTIKKSSSRSKVNIIFEEEEESDIKLSDIKDKVMLQRAVDVFLKNLTSAEYHLKEIHQYTQILPEKYYKPGSHLINRLVAFALKHTDERLFLSWVMLRSKASDFEYDTIPSLYTDWKTHFHKKSDGVTKRSILYWAKQDAFEEYQKVKQGTIDYIMEETLLDATDFDFATILFEMFKDKYVCSNITTKRWYVFKTHKWEKDEGLRLRLAISTDLYHAYQRKSAQYLIDLQQSEAKEGDEGYIKIQHKLRRVAEITIKLRKTTDKNNIMREAMEIFFDKDFIQHMDANPYLMCFKNGVVDFKTKTFRDGYPQDYITKSTRIPYIPYDTNNTTDIVQNINTFMKQLFPSPSLSKYMWDHLASCLIGIKKEHAFNIYCGSGSNGKSILTDLMSQALGEYKGTVPITLVTEKRVGTGGTSSEVIQLKGIRYAVMQEPSKGAVINEGIMKELTGGDPIQARALYSDSEIFVPQFSLVVCTNELFEIKSNDDGTWRRMKKVDFVSKFISKDEKHTDDTKFVFPKDKSLKEKLPLWAPVFISMLVKIAFETDGEVIDCAEVVSASDKYRQSQDNISAFINEKIEKHVGGSVGKRVLSDTFKEWYLSECGSRKMPRISELEEAMNKKFGNKSGKPEKWLNVRIIYDNEQDGLDELVDDM
jgi:P4 family phage/plasmid primase-like protien